MMGLNKVWAYFNVKVMWVHFHRSCIFTKKILIEAQQLAFEIVVVLCINNFHMMYHLWW